MKGSSLIGKIVCIRTLGLEILFALFGLHARIVG